MAENEPKNELSQNRNQNKATDFNHVQACPLKSLSAMRECVRAIQISAFGLPPEPAFSLAVHSHRRVTPTTGHISRKWSPKIFPMKNKRGSKTPRRKRPTSRKTRIKKQRGKPAVVRRTLSEINYDHWWREHRYWDVATTLSRDEQKAAVFYEAYRRCPILRDTWLSGIRGAKAMVNFGWQMFAATALDHLPKTWIQLPEWLRKSITITQLAEMLPPVGYSVWPAKPAFYKKKNELTPSELAELEQYHQRRRNLAAAIIVVPSKDDSPLPFLKELQRLDSDGFLIIAIDNKSSEAFNYAIQSLQRRLKDGRSYRIADLYWQWPRDADAIQNVEGWHGIQRIKAGWRAIGKRVKKAKRGIILEEKIFKFQELCKGLESYDKTGTPSDLMKRLRLGTG